MKIIKILLPTILIGLFIGIPFAFAGNVSINQPTTLTPNVAQPGDLQSLNNVGPNNLALAILNLRNWFAGIVLIISVLVILYGAFLYMTSGGDTKKTGTARGWIIGGVVGTIIALIAFGLTTFILNMIKGFAEI